MGGMNLVKRIKQVDKRWWWVLGGLSLFYWILHLPQLTFLPIFADEAIYIRWAQLILDDPGRYLFFPLNDGKTPLFIWSLVPWLQAGFDPLWMARFWSLVGGYVQMGLLGILARTLGLRRGAVALSMLLGAVLPFWYFNSRLALMDVWLSVWLSLSLWATLKLVLRKSGYMSVEQEVVDAQFNRPKCLLINSWQVFIADRSAWKWIFILAISLGAAIWTKLPAVLWLSVLPIWAFYPKNVDRVSRLVFIWQIAVGLALGLGLFVLLAFVPSFPQLFSRGGDFLFSFPDLIAQPIGSSLRRLLSFPVNIAIYATPLVLITPLIGLMFKDHRRLQIMLLFTILAFLVPMMVLGRVVFSRYLLPAAIPLTLSAGVLIASLLALYDQSQTLVKKGLVALGLGLYLSNVLSGSTAMIVGSLVDLNLLPLNASDRSQYLQEWSAGFGTKQVTEALLEQSKDKRIVVASEGYFGSLPDGLLVYLYRQPVDNIFVDGIGQPVRDIPDDFWQKVDQLGGYDQAWLVVNSHRNFIDFAPEQLLAEYCRPLGGVCLQVIRINDSRAEAP